MSAPLCKDCKHVRRDLIDTLGRRWEFALCAAVMSPSASPCEAPGRSVPVTGRPRQLRRDAMAYCEIERAHEGNDCGPEGKLFEPKRGPKPAAPKDSASALLEELGIKDGAR